MVEQCGHLYSLAMPILKTTIAGTISKICHSYPKPKKYSPSLDMRIPLTFSGDDCQLIGEVMNEMGQYKVDQPTLHKAAHRLQL
ncbi:hypothetical protein [Neptunomonas japonica]|uniref:hypothetical protein n=1 Tax=Neptunomonas japonica TaxID=417574 RepID=UPI000491589C|nr:hypothetical protein [Neptunomonas japonica]